LEDKRVIAILNRTKMGKGKMKYMICSKCSNIIAETDVLFDIWDTSWFCKSCETCGFSSDGWEEVGNLLIPS
jgi:hypothetical protein